MTADLCDLTAEETARRVAAGETTAVAVLESVVARIEAVEGRSPSVEPYQPQPADRTKVHAFVTRTIARSSPGGRRRGEAGRIRAAGGVPLAVKDIFVRGTLSRPARAFWRTSALLTVPPRWRAWRPPVQSPWARSTWRIRFRLVERVVGLPAAARQSVGSAASPRRLIRWERRLGRRRRGDSLPRDRHRRLSPPACRVLRDRGA
jgi:hypothetical protein